MFSKRLRSISLAFGLVLAGIFSFGCSGNEKITSAPSPTADATAPATAVRTLPTATTINTPTSTLTLSNTLGPTPDDETSESAVTAEPTPTPTPLLYVVQAGDTLITIAVDFGFSELSPLLEANDLPDEYALYEGQVLIIPPVPSAESSKMVRYRVEVGDTFASIAAKFGVSSEDLQRANPNIEPGALQVGQELNVPWDCIHVLGPGDTLAGIAARYQVSYDDLIEANKDVLDFTNLDLLYPGTELVIPCDEESVAVDCSPQPPRTRVIEYTVQRGERLFCLARKFGISETTLLYANPHLISEGGLTDGTTIYVPPGDGALYTITETDVENDVTLEDIALWYSAYGGMGQIVDWEGNEIPLPLSAGQQLFIPGADLLAGPFNSAIMIEIEKATPKP